ncbi:DUF3800 domain-containing protein [Rhodococcus hoagii]|nr:DUF3800 domain-containing protein [Prescottella equi]MBM4721422.1 DUF3800 domain-containing protein [Prescottella equi]
MTYTALLVRDREWSPLLERWIGARRSISSRFGISKNAELHASPLMGGRNIRGSALGDEKQRITKHQAPTIYRDMVSAVPGPGVHLITVGVKGSDSMTAYALLLEELEKWATQEDSYLLMMYDGKELGRGDSVESEDAILRDHSPLRALHRELPIKSRRIIEDVVTKDSRYSQFIQAVDLLAYGAFYHDVWQNPDRWPRKVRDAQSADQRIRMTRYFAQTLDKFDTVPNFVWVD